MHLGRPGSTKGPCFTSEVNMHTRSDIITYTIKKNHCLFINQHTHSKQEKDILYIKYINNYAKI